ncbi:hypothetical protein Q8F55_009039 [Vanrija albida]|uniref:C2H2-type domain-containing protein n=1 Tax=Vanrija albida TaxID=181172 RepID=A0ABR3PTH0_9TREE
MIEGQYAQQSQFDNRDSRDRRDEYPSSQSYTTTTTTAPNPGSPPTSASPFAFVPPPLSSTPANSSRPAAMHQSEQAPAQDYSAYYGQRSQASLPPAAPGGGSAASGAYSTYSGSHPMTYRVSGAESTRAAPPAPLTRVPSYSVISQAGAQPSPTATSPYYPPPRAAGQPYAAPQHSPRGTNSMYPAQGYYPQAYQPTAVDMPRSLSYPSNYPAPYAAYLPSLSTPALVPHSEGLPSLMRNHSTSAIGVPGGANIGYAFANRLPLVDRPFKCDQCVQSFNRNHDLKRHKRIHLSVKPYGCEKCGKTFSRKDALRRHWMVRGCRGEEGATAPITPTFPLNGPPPALSPSTPPNGSSGDSASSTSNGNGNSYGSNTMSFSHPSAPPPLTSLPPRQSSDKSQILLTPNEVASQQRFNSSVKLDSSSDSASGGLGESVVIDPALSGMDSSRGSANSLTEGDSYFDGVSRKDSIGAVPDSATSSTFSRYAASPKDDLRHHPYRRSALPSPSTHPVQASSIGPDGKPMFSMPFSQGPHGHSLLAPIESDDHKDGGNNDWPRWQQRPPYPFPSSGSSYAGTPLASPGNIHHDTRTSYAS